MNHLVVRAMKLGKDRPLALPALFSLGPLPRGTPASIIVGWDTAASSLWCTFSLGTIGGNMPLFTASVAFHWSSFSAIGRAFFSPPGRGGRSPVVSGSSGGFLPGRSAISCSVTWFSAIVAYHFPSPVAPGIIPASSTAVWYSFVAISVTVAGASGGPARTVISGASGP